MDIAQLIENFGFPIAVTIACGYFIFKMYNNMVSENATREERNYKMMEKFSISIEKFSTVLEVYENRLGNIETDVKVIKDIVNK
ncbi:MAG: hypothetical protein SA378_10910 [Sedimentibacter sp.]|uniref:hypothetical protein n=1 Tax=Sedimentibacter sp. TaxID=1960295 RepID=UPI002980D3A9|nr:hypothetical protein [Sedimentibacter sp.]MDW5300628.1 hypothetical protein [Sedimentibacter sp.]